MRSRGTAVQVDGEQAPVAMQAAETGSWEPSVVAFLCNWCSYAAADLAGTNRIEYPANVRVIRVPCAGQVDPVFILRSFQRGADGVLVSGCHPGDCHYGRGSYYAGRRMTMFRKLVEFVGIDPRRLQMSWVSASEGTKWAQVVTEVTREIEKLGPLRLLGTADARDR